jgi:plastocyanin
MNQNFTMSFTGDINRPATRAEVAQIVVDAFKVNSETPIGNRYDDVTASTSHGFAIEALSRDNVVSGDTDASGRSLARFRPTANINRAEVTKIAMGARTNYGLKGATAASSSSKKPVASSSSSAAAAGKTIIFTQESGFQPPTITIQKGTKVIFKNDSQSNVWPASNPHPAHTMYPEFDPRRSLMPGDTYEFTFDRVGKWGYHNHIGPGGGTVEVTE